MTQQTTTIRKLATLVNTPVDKLLEQLAGAGMDFTDPDQAVTSTEKVKLLGFLRRSHGKDAPKTVDATTPKKITLNRSKKQEITVGGGKNRMTVDVTVRKKVTLVKPSALKPATGAAPQAAPPVVEGAPVAVAPPIPPVEAPPVVVTPIEPVSVVETAADTTPVETVPVETAPVVEPVVAKTPAKPDAATAPAEPAASAETKPVEVKPAEADPDAKPKTTTVRKKVRKLSPAELERQEILRKLEESRRRNLEEQQRLAESDRRRDEERKAEAERARLAAIEAERKAAERAAAAVAGTAEEPATGTRKPAAGAAKPGAAKAPAKSGKDGARHGKGQRGSNAMSSDDDDAPRFAGQLHLSASDRDRRSRSTRGKAGGRGRRQVIEPSRSGGSGAHGFERPTAPVVREVAIGEAITVADLAGKLALKGGDVVKALFKMGVMVTINQTIDHDTAVLVVEELGHTAVAAERDDAESALFAQHLEQASGERQARPPVITIMGHVDHGKTSLLDYIRRTKVAPGEAGGITQHIGAYHVETDKGVISFLDTPGHSAFASMRARGAKLTDVVVLVVAADDGVMPQTIEAIQHARTAKVPLVVAINKIDKSGADPGKIKNELLAHDVVAEDFGGDTQMVELSAKTGQGVDELLDALLLQAEVLELTAITEGRASGTVIESSLDKGRGPVATVLVQQGQLGKGDYLVCGIQYGRVRALFDETGKQVASAGPSIPVQVLGLSGVPEAGDDFIVVEDERLAKDVAQQRDTKRRELRLVATASNRMEDIMAKMGQSEVQEVLNLVVKADVQGSVEALKQALTALSNEQIRINVLVAGVGGITESDANAAATAKATIIGFNVRADASARRVIETNGLDLRYFSIIYDVIDQVKQVASGLLGVEIREEIIGTAEVRDVFRSSKFGAIAGSMVIEGVVKRNKPIRVLRDSVVVFEGELESLRRFKENVDEVRNGTECGIGVKAYNDVKPGDQIECFERIEVQRTL